MLYITGDCHSDFSRFSTRAFPAQRRMSKEDCILICGDFGGVWDRSPSNEHWLDWLEEKHFTTLFVDGNHENFDLLDSMPTEHWKGGLVHQVRPSVLHLCRGEVFQLEDMRLFVMGGASSHDKPDGVLRQGPDLKRQRKMLDRRGGRYRVEHENWWAQELPDEAQLQRARANLEEADWQVDLVVTHCAPTALQAQIVTNRPPDRLTDFLEEVRGKLSYRRWYCGHYHRELCLPRERLQVLYHSICPVDLEEIPVVQSEQR